MFRVKPGRRRTDSKVFNFRVFISKRSTRNITFLLGVTFLLGIRRLHQNASPLRGNQDPAPRLCYCFLTVPPSSLRPLPSLISDCLNLPLGTWGRSWRLNEAHFLRTRNGGHREAFVPRSLTGPCLVTLPCGVCEDSMGKFMHRI